MAGSDGGGGTGEGGDGGGGGDGHGGAIAVAGGGGTGEGGDGGGGGAPDQGGAGGAAGAGGTPPVAVRFDYFHDGESIGFFSELGDSGEVVAHPGSAPDKYVFAEADVDETGLFSNRRQSVMYLSGGSLYRLDGEADAPSPPDPARVTTLSGVTKICDWLPVAHPSDRAQSELLIRYVTDGESCGGSLLSARLPLLAGPDDEPELWDGLTRPLRDWLGNTDAHLRLESGNLVVVADYDDPTVLVELFPLTFVSSYYAYPLGDGRYFLIIQKASTLWDIYAYDTSDHSLSAALGSDFSSVDGPGGWRHRTASAVYFTATKAGTTTIHRLAVSGASAVEPLAGVTQTTLYGVVDGQVLFSTPDGVFRVAADADFAFSPTPSTVLGSAVSVRFISEDRLFYGSGNFAGAVKLDGTTSS